MPQNPTQLTQEEQEAYRLLYDEVHGPVFFEKLAERGIAPQSEPEAQALLDMGANLFQSQLIDRQKQASHPQGSFILKAAESLNEALADRGLMPRPAPALDQVIKAASYRLAQDPKIQRAALTYQDFLVRQQAG